MTAADGPKLEEITATEFEEELENAVLVAYKHYNSLLCKYQKYLFDKTHYRIKYLKSGETVSYNKEDKKPIGFKYGGV